MNNLCGLPVDWAATGSFLGGIGALIAAGAAVFASRTFKDWKRQKVAERRMEHAEKILAAAYRAKYNLIELRSPIHSGMERESAGNS